VEHELERYYNTYFDLFSSEGWKQYVQDVRDNRVMMSDVLTVKDGNDINPCPECGLPAARLISTPMVKLDGTSGAFPGEAMKWERKHAEKLKQEQKRSGE